MLRFLTFLVVVAIAAPAFAQVPSSAPDAALRAALRDYKSGDVKQGVSGLLAMPSDKLTGAVDELMRANVRGRNAGDRDFGDLEIAATALVDAAMSASPQSPQFRSLWRLGARVGLTLVKAGDSSKAIRAWCLLADAVGEDAHDFTTLDQLLTEARAIFRGDAEILFVSGSMRESLAQAQIGEYGPKGRNVTIVPTGTSQRNPAGFLAGIGWWTPNGDRSANLKASRDHYREALAIAPSHAEARLRLARVLHQLDDLPGALSALEALPKDLPQEFAYLSRLFRAGIEDSLGHSDKARAAYLSAMEWRAHAPFVGLASVLRASGDADGALAVTTRLLSDAPDFDPWWSYLRGQGWHLTERLNAARAAIR